MVSGCPAKPGERVCHGLEMPLGFCVCTGRVLKLNAFLRLNAMLTPPCVSQMPVNGDAFLAYATRSSDTDNEPIIIWEGVRTTEITCVRDFVRNTYICREDTLQRQTCFAD